jgi:nucleoside-diphosphate-sugar epimerase
MYLQNQNIRYTLDAVRLAKALRCGTFVGVGSQAEYGRVGQGEACRIKLASHTPTFPENGYGAAKLAAGQMSRIMCRQLGIHHVWARLLSVYGPYDREKTMVMSAALALLRGERPMFSAGGQLWDYLYVSDAAEALYRMAEYGKDGAVYPVGSGQARPLTEYIMEIRETVSPGAELGIGELPYAEGQVMYLCADITSLTNDTGFVPKVSFQDGIRETVSWCRKVYGYHSDEDN